MLSYIWFLWTIFPSNWLAGPCPNDACVEELVSTKTSCFRTR